MKRHVIIGLLTMLVLTPAVEVFSASMDTPMMLTPEQQEELSVLAPGVIWEFPYAPSSVGGLTFTLIITNRTTTPLPIVITTVPSGQAALQRLFTLGPAQILSFIPADVSCASGLVCRLGLTFGGGAIPAFDAVLEILSTTTSVPVGFLTPTLAIQ